MNNRERLGVNVDDNNTDWDSLADFALPEQGDSLKVGVVNSDKDLLAKARFIGENKLAEELNVGGVKGVIAKIWKGSICRSYYRQKYINEAKHDLLEAKTLVLDGTSEERIRHNRDSVKLFLSDFEESLDEKAGDSRISLLQNNPALHSRISDIVSRYADGSIDNLDSARREFNDALEDLGDNYGDGHLAQTNIEDVVIEARRRFEDLMTVTEACAGRLEHDDAMTRVMSGFDLLYGERRLDRLDPHYNKVDSIVDKISNTRIGSIVSPETIGLATGAVACVAELFGKRLTKSALCMVPGLSGAIIGGLKEGSTFEQERARAKVDARYDRGFDGEQKRRAEIMDTIHEHVNAMDFARSLREDCSEYVTRLNNGEDVESRKNELLSSLAKCKYYLELEKTDNAVFKYSNEVDAPAEQLRLLEWYSRAKDTLRSNGIEDIDDRLSTGSELASIIREQIDESISAKDECARKLKTRRILRRSAIGLLSGAAIGFAASEIRAAFDPNIDGLLDKDTGIRDYSKSLSAGKKMALWLKGERPSTSGFDVNYDLNNPDIIVSDSDAYGFSRASEGTYNLLRDGKLVASGLDWNSETGELTKESIDLLGEQGIDVTRFDNASIMQDVTESYSTSVTKFVGIDEYYEKAGDQIQTVKRAFWYDNDTSVFDKNELRCYGYNDPVTGRYGFSTGMLDDGSYHDGSVATFSELARNGEIKLLISPTSDYQSKPIEVIGELTEDGQLVFCPQEGDIAANFFVGNEFIGKYAEVVRSIGVDENGIESVAPLATVVGDGFSGELPIIDESVVEETKSIDVPLYSFFVREQATEFLMIFPFTPSGAMNESKYRRDSSRPSPSINDQSHDYYGRTTGADNYGVLSPRISERKKLKLGEEVSWFVDQVKEKRSDDYVEFLDNAILTDTELNNLGNNVKTIITIPVHAPSDYDSIYGALSLYARQADVDMNSFVVMIDMNHREVERNFTADEIEYGYRRGAEEIRRAKHDFPGLHVAQLNHMGHTGVNEMARTMNDVAMWAINNAIVSGQMSPDNDVLIVRNDIDLKHLDKNYVSSYQEAAKKNQKTPLFTGTTWFNINRQRVAPGFGAVLGIERLNNMFGAIDGNIHTAGGNFAYRASHFAAVGGFGFEADGSFGGDWTGAGSDDLRVGYRVSDCFRNAFNERYENFDNDSLMDASTRMLVRVGGANIDTDDTRYLRFYGADSDAVINDAYGNNGYGANFLRGEDIDDFSEDLNDRQRCNFVFEQFEREMTNFVTLNSGLGRLGEIINDFLDCDYGDGFYEVFETGNLDFAGRTIYEFKLTPEGRDRYREVLISKMGDGRNSNDIHNTLQNAIDSGSWLAPIN